MSCPWSQALACRRTRIKMSLLQCHGHVAFGGTFCCRTAGANHSVQDEDPWRTEQEVPQSVLVVVQCCYLVILLTECLLEPPSGGKLEDRFHHSSSYSVCCLSLLHHLLWLDRLPAHLVTETGRPMSLPAQLPLPLPPFFNSCSSMKIMARTTER